MKRKIFLSLSFLSLSLLFNLTLLAQSEYNSIDYKSFEKANAVFSDLEQFNYAKIDTIRCKLEGVWYYQGHYELPRAHREMPYSASLVVAANNYNKLISKYRNGETEYTQEEYFTSDSAYIIPYRFDAAQEGDYMRKMSSIPFYSPISVYWDMKMNKASLRYIGEDEQTITLSYASSFHKQVSVIIDMDSKHILTAQMLQYDSLEGDYYLTFNYLDYQLEDEIYSPQSLLIQNWNKPSMKLNYTEFSANRTKKLDPSEGYSIKEIADNLFLIELPTNEHQSFVADYGDYIGIIEFPLSEVYAKQIIEFVKRKFPNKPIKYAFLTHHHPDHAGGFAYCYKNDISVVTTPITHQYLLELLDRKHLLRNEATDYTSLGKFIVLPSHQEKKFYSSKLKMIAYEMGENSHTKEFILYYFPQSKILIVGDLYYTSATTKGISISRRASEIMDFVKRKKLNVDKFYQTWGWNAKEFSSLEEIRESSDLYNERVEKLK